MPLSALLEPSVRYAKAAAALAEGPKAVRIGRTPKRLVRRDGRTALYRYAAPSRRARGAAPVLIVYALINKPAIMDLLPGRSIVEVLRAAGHDVWLLDWGVPGPEAASEGLEEHVTGYLHRAVEAVRKAAKADAVSLFGYCMGGTLSVMYAALEPARVSRLLAAVAPIRGRQSEGFIHFASDPAFFQPGVMTLQGNVAPEALNAGFMLLRPVENMFGKYVRYFEKAGDPRFDELFFAMERWVAEGQPLPGRLYREFVQGVYQEDLLVTTGVPVGARRARAADVRCPVAVVSSAQDHLVPPSSTQALLDLAASREKRRFDFPGGHVGLAVSPKALATVWKDAATWLAKPGKPGSKDLKSKMRRRV